MCNWSIIMVPWEPVALKRPTNQLENSLAIKTVNKKLCFGGPQFWTWSKMVHGEAVAVKRPTNQLEKLPLSRGTVDTAICKKLQKKKCFTIQLKVASFWLRLVFYLNLMIIVLQVCFIHPGTLSPEKPTQKLRTLRPQYGRRALPNNYIWYGKWENHAMCGEKNVEILNHIPCSFASLLITFTFKEGSWRNISWGTFSNFAIYAFNMCDMWVASCHWHTLHDLNLERCIDILISWLWWI